jgi:N5-(cytidine 5'-diphosphoramidyl)-L-glutamine hydrolase
MKKLRIGISTRIIPSENYIDDRDALSHDWASLLEKISIIPILIPNSLLEIEEFLDDMDFDGVILSGGDNIGEFPLRDKTENKIMEYAIIKKTPIFGVCRGMQIINKFFGGDVIKTKDKKHVGKPHKIIVDKEKIFSFVNEKEIIVNSFHNNIIIEKKLGKNLISIAKDINDKSIEAFIHSDYKIIGTMWHPERMKDKKNQNLIKIFFESEKK